MRKAKRENKSYSLELFKALILALIISLVLVLIAAFSIQIFNIPTGAIPIINQVIRGISILLAAFFCLRLPKNGWIRGLIFGILYTMIAFVVFSLFGQEFNFGLALLNDIAFGAVAGVIAGMICVNLRSRK